MTDEEWQLYFRDLDMTLRTCLDASKYSGADMNNQIAFRTLKRHLKVAEAIVREIEKKNVVSAV